MNEFTSPCSSRRSWNMPIIGRSVPKNQPSVKPFHGSAGNSESLKANIAAAASGGARKTKKATT